MKNKEHPQKRPPSWAKYLRFLNQKRLPESLREVPGTGSWSSHHRDLLNQGLCSQHIEYHTHNQPGFERSEPFSSWCLFINCMYMGISKNRGTTKWMVKIMENPIKMGWFGGTTIFGNIHMSTKMHFFKMQVLPSWSMMYPAASSQLAQWAEPWASQWSKHAAQQPPQCHTPEIRSLVSWELYWGTLEFPWIKATLCIKTTSWDVD